MYRIYKRLPLLCDTNKRGDMIIFLDRVTKDYTRVGISEDIYDSFGSLFSLDILRGIFRMSQDHQRNE
jgi:hypothetical protein